MPFEVTFFEYLTASGHLGYWWLLLAIIFLLAELSTPGLFFFVAFAVGAFCAAPFAFLGHTLLIQMIVALLVSLSTFLWIRRHFAKQVYLRGDAKTNIETLAGQSGMVTREITSRGSGLVKVRGEVWSARSRDAGSLKKGSIVTVLFVQGNHLIVTPKK